ncbi:MAG: hypothetical protein BroJett018_42540 [Chloroflexota bacterium]|nr:MAG: hypothetical protein BroJett018_42540 [Chloroflexota bacterium]
MSQLPIQTSSGKYKIDFTDEHGLYALTQRMADRSSTVRQVKDYLARAGVIVDEIRRDPEKGTEAAIEAYRRQGKNEQWIETRIQGQVARDHFIQALKAAVDIELREFHYGAATNEIYLGLWRRTAAILKEQMELPRHAKLRDHQPQLALMYQMIAEETASIELGDALYVSWDEAKRIVRSVAEFIGRQARATGKRLGIDIATGKPLLKSGK